MDLALKKLWVGLLLFFCVEMVLSEIGDTCEVAVDPETVIRMAQNCMTEGKILQELVEKAMKNGDNAKMIKGIKGLKISNLALPNTSLDCMPESTLLITVVMNITVAGKSFIGGQMAITVVGGMIMPTQVAKSSTNQIDIKILDCKVELMSCKTNLPSSMLPKIVNKFLDSTLGKVMPGVLCPAADTLVKKLLDSFSKMFEKKPIGKSGYITYELAETPVVHATYIQINLKIKLQNKNGEIIEVTSGSVTYDPPTKENGKTAIYIPVCFINAVMELLNNNFNFAVTRIKGSVPTTDQLKQMWPEAGLPSGKQVKLQITQKENVKFTVASTGSYMTSRSKVSFLSVKGGAELLSVDMVQECDASFEVINEQLGVTLESGSCRTTEISSPAENAEPAKDYMAAIMNDHIPQLNDVLNKNRVPLPSLLNVTRTTTAPELSSAENMLVLQMTIKSYDKNEMAKKVKQKCNALKLR